jgi:hypothetical protein
MWRAGSGGIQQSERKPNVTDSSISSSHPGWCDPRFCRESDIDVHHRSAPTVLPLVDHVWRLSLLRCDEAVEHGGLELGEPELHAVLSDARVSHPVVQVSMLVDEVPEVCAALMRQYHRAQMLTAAQKRAAS